MNILKNLFRKIVPRRAITFYDADDKISSFIIETILEYRKKENGTHPYTYLKEEWDRREKLVLVGFYSYLLNSGKSKEVQDFLEVKAMIDEVVKPGDRHAFSEEVLEDLEMFQTTYRVREKYWRIGMKKFYSDFMLYWL